jgi:hypothetical protein
MFAPSPIELLNSSRPERPPVDVAALARVLGLGVRSSATLPGDAAGMIVRAEGSLSGYIIYINAKDNPRRQRFTLAHEIAHYILHRDMIGDGITDDAMYRSALGDVYERQANRMAADILMPAQLVKNYYRFSAVPPPISSFAREFGVSEDAMRIRLQELGLIASPTLMATRAASDQE